MVKISFATRSFPIILAWDQAPLWGNERHLKKIGEQSQPTAGNDNMVFANQNCFQFLLWITVQEKLKTVLVQNFGWQRSKVNYGKSESGEVFNSRKQILLLRKIVTFYYCYLYAIHLDCKFINWNNQREFSLLTLHVRRNIIFFRC